MTQQRTTNIFILLAILVMGVMPVWAFVDYQDYDGDGRMETYNVVYLDLDGGNDNNDGSSTAPVKSWAKAYGKLPQYTGTTNADRDAAWDSNIIVVCGTPGIIKITEANTGNRPATITGIWPWTAEYTTASYVKTNGGKVLLDDSNSSTARLGADTKFKYIRFGSASNKGGFLMMYLHDTWFDVGCMTHEISNSLTNALGLINDGKHKAPDMEVFMFSNTYGFTTTTTDGGWNSLMKKPVTLTIRSGKFGRILSTRITGTTVDLIKARYVVGNPSKPLMCIVNVDIDPTTSTGDWNPSKFTDDIAYLCAGSTQGAEYCDVEFNVERGRIGTLVGAMQGNTITKCPDAGLSNSSFFGRTICNIDRGEENDVNIYRYYATCFGRQTDSQTSTANAAFYGQSILNMYGGTIEAGAYVSAGGITGLQSPDGTYHTNDQYIPYLDNTDAYKNYPFMGINYQPYDADKTIAKITTTLKGTPEIIDLAETFTQINIHGGTINGGVFGGGYGYSPELPASVAIAGAGSLWGETNVNIYGGTINGGVYGGGYGSSEYYTGAADAKKADFLDVATVYGNTNVNIYGGTIDGGIYGGGKGVAASSANEYTDIAKVYGNTNVIINPTDPSWTFTGNIYGGGAMGAVTGNTNVQILGGNITGNVYAASAGEEGHPNKGKIGGAPSATIAGGTISQNVYGGGQLAPVEGDPFITLAGGTISQDIYGGGDEAPVTGNPLVEAQFGSVNDIFAGGRGATAVVTGDPKAYINKTDNETLTVRDVYGGGDAANVVGTANVQLDKGSVATVYGGGNAANVTNTDVVINGGQATMAFAGGHGDKDAAPQKEANVTGDAQLTIHGGTVGKAFAGSNSKGSIAGAQTLSINKTGDALAELHVTEAYGGGNQADGKAGTIEVGCTGGEAEGVGDLFGGAREANITNDINLTLEAGKIGRIFGGNNVSGNVTGTITVNIAENITKYDCGLHAGSVYGGGQDAAYSAPEAGAYPKVNINGGSIANDVFGGGLGVTAVVTGSPVVTVNGGTVSGSVYGGGALANVTGNTRVDLLGGTIHDSYGGGLGSNEVAALVSGNATTTLNGAKVTGSIFGANNVNGTPKGHVKVHVLATTPRDGQTAGQYDVAAVYGGGNQAAYEPTSGNDSTEVLIENCSNSIDYVYGGGNAAPVPATSVTIYGANAINNAFAGGNGAGIGNPGADIGYQGYYSRGAATAYGSGKSHITVYGGTVNNVYGGSNTLGYIRTHAYVDIMTTPDNYGGAPCPLHVGNTYAGGNQAAMFCGGSMTLACSEGADVVYAGANSADIYGDIDLVINSGTYGKVFGGNNIRGNVYGHININIDETGCYPIMIGELYGGGNEAAYSVYGYTNEGPRTKAQYDAMTSDEKTAAGVPYTDPTINIISFTGIGRVFGGGKGETAVVYGNPTININPIKGVFAGQHPKPLFVLNNDYERIPNDHELNIPDAVGKIAAVYGGGNAAAVYGNTTVNIGNQAQNHHLTPGAADQPVDAIIAGNIYGGGSQADINGNTHVNIQIGTVLGDVFGGGEGVEGDANKAKVTGTTKVTIGE